jgi:excisionase family DNA binding protein
VTALDPRDRLEDALRDQLRKAWRSAIAYVASDMLDDPSLLGYPEEEAGAAAVMAAYDACATEGDGDGSRLLKAREVAAAARVSVGSVYRAVERGELRAVRIGRAYRIRERDALRFLGTANGGN